MSHEYLKKQRVYATVADFGAVATILTFQSVVPIDVYRFGLVTTGGLTSGTGITVDLATIVPIGGSTGSFTSFTRTTNAVAGAWLYKDVIVPVAQTAGEDALGGALFQTSLIDVGPSGPCSVDVGSQVLVRVTAEQAGTTAGAGFCFIEFVEHDAQKGWRESVATISF